MGLIKAAIGSALGVAADQWKDYFYCDALPADVIAVKGRRRAGAGGNNGSDNIITNGSVIAVADGQCMIIVDQGRVVDVCAEPGEYTYDMSTEPSIFCGDLSDAVPSVMQSIGKRFTYGGEAPADQRVYYFNTKELVGNKYGTPNPIPFRVVDTNVGLDVDISIRCFGEYSYRVTNPILFYTNVCGNVDKPYTRERIDGQLKSELLTALQPAFAKLSDLGIRYSALPGHTAELADALNDVLSQKWSELRGVEIVSLGISSVTASEEDERMIKDLQKSSALRDADMADAVLAGARADAIRSAAANTSAGPAMAFVGMNMAENAGGAASQQRFGMDVQAKNADTWKCTCGAVSSGKFCPQCGSPRPVAANGWTCSCGALNKGRFCSECGSPKPAGALLYKCDKCGWEPRDPANPPKFCPQCGDPFNDADIQQ